MCVRLGILHLPYRTGSDRSLHPEGSGSEVLPAEAGHRRRFAGLVDNGYKLPIKARFPS